MSNSDKKKPSGTEFRKRRAEKDLPPGFPSVIENENFTHKKPMTSVMATSL